MGSDGTSGVDIEVIRCAKEGNFKMLLIFTATPQICLWNKNTDCWESADFFRNEWSWRGELAVVEGWLDPTEGQPQTDVRIIEPYKITATRYSDVACLDLTGLQSTLSFNSRIEDSSSADVCLAALAVYYPSS